MSGFGRGSGFGSGGGGSRAGRSGGRAGKSGKGSGGFGGGPGVIEVVPTARMRRHWVIQVTLFLLRWLPELLVVGFLSWVTVAFSHRTGFDLRVSALVVYVAVMAPLLVPGPRRGLVSLVGMDFSRHRIRSFFLNCRVYNRAGRLPVPTLMYPTPVGEQVWFWLPPGLAISDIASQTEELAAACWARDARVSRSRRFSMIVKVHVIRRDPLASTEVPSAVAEALGQQEEALVEGQEPATGGTDRTDTPFMPTPRSSEKAGSTKAGRTKAGSTKAGESSGVPWFAVDGEDVSDYL